MEAVESFKMKFLAETIAQIELVWSCYVRGIESGVLIYLRRVQKRKEDKWQFRVPPHSVRLGDVRGLGTQSVVSTVAWPASGQRFQNYYDSNSAFEMLRPLRLGRSSLHCVANFSVQ